MLVNAYSLKVKGSWLKGYVVKKRVFKGLHDIPEDVFYNDDQFRLWLVKHGFLSSKPIEQLESQIQFYEVSPDPYAVGVDKVTPVGKYRPLYEFYTKFL